MRKFTIFFLILQYKEPDTFLFLRHVGPPDTKTTVRNVASSLMKEDFAQKLARPGALDSLRAKLAAVMSLTWPAILAQMSNIVMEYIDASMVGSLGADPAAAIGLVATSTWLIWGLGAAACTGFAVQVAHRVGAGDDTGARAVFRQSVVTVTLLATLIALAGVALSPGLPHWLGGGDEICGMASWYFGIFSGGMPLMVLTFLVTGMLRSSGNMTVPGITNIAMCLMDVVFNFFLIFPTRTVSLFGAELTMPGAGLGVPGAALGTVTAYFVGGVYMYIYIVRRSPHLCHPYAGLTWKRRLSVSAPILRNARSISWPVALERTVMCGAQILITSIVAPLGNAAIAANSFAVTAESLCYAPGYGVSDAATTLVGQSLGAGRRPLALSMARICVIAGMTVMGLLGAVMWLLAPEMMSLFSNDADVLSLGTTALRTEAWAEAFFGAAIVIYGIFIGAGYTKVPAAINFGSIWIVRLTLSAILAPRYGLFGVWLAMCIELTVRGLVFIVALLRGRWLRKAHVDLSDADGAQNMEEETPQGPDIM